MGLSDEQRRKLYDEHSMDNSHKRSYDSKDAGGFKDIFNRTVCAQYNVNFWKPNPGDHIIDILPFLAGPNMPIVQGVKTQAGEPDYLLDLWVHRNVGPNEDQYICLAKSYSSPCPICEHRKSGELNEEELELTRPKRRTVYAIWDRDAESKGVQVWEIAHWYMEKKLLNRSKRPREGGYVKYSNAKIGKSISFTITAIGKNKEYDGHDFLNRDEPIPEEILAMVPPLDALIHIPDYDEVNSAYFAKKSAVVKDEEEPEEHFEEHGSEPEPELKPEKPKSGNKCPVDLTFGVDFDQYEDCDECVVYMECKKAKEGEKPARRPRRRE